MYPGEQPLGGSVFRLPSLVRLLDECQSSFERLLAPPANLETLPTEERTIAEVSFLGMLRKKMTPGGDGVKPFAFRF